MNEPSEGEDHGLGHRPEQVARDAAQLEHRHEHDAQAQQRHERRNHDLLRAIENGRLDLLAELEVIVDVLDGDRAVVHQDADREREPPEGHDVDAIAEPGERREREQHGERDLDEDDRGRAPAAEKQQDHHAHQRGGQDHLAQHAGDCRLHEHRLIADRV